MALKLAAGVVGCLKERSEERFSARQIAEWVFATYPDECQEKRVNSRGDSSGLIRIWCNSLWQKSARSACACSRSIQSSKQLKGGRARTTYSERSDSAEVAAVENDGAAPAADASTLKIDEHALSLMLSQFLRERLGVLSKRIDERRSSSKRGLSGNLWLYPDVVGMEDLGKEGHREVRDCVTQHSARHTKLWSVEAKLLINRSNVCE